MPVSAPRAGVRRKRLREPHPESHQPRVVLAELGADGARMEAGRDEARGAARQLAGEEDVGELRDAVLPHRREAAGRVEVVQIDAREGMRPRGRGDHPRAVEPIEQEIGHQERPEMVHREHDLVPAGRQAAAGREDPGIVDQHVDARRARTQHVAAGADGLLVADVADDEVHARVTGGVADRRRSLLAALAAAADERHRGAVACEGGRDLSPDARVRAGDDAPRRHAGAHSGTRLPSSAARRARASTAARHRSVGAIGSCATPISRRTISMAA